MSLSHFLSAAKASLNTRQSSVSLERVFRVLSVLSLTVAKVDAMGLVVRMCCQ